MQVNARAVSSGNDGSRCCAHGLARTPWGLTFTFCEAQRPRPSVNLLRFSAVTLCLPKPRPCCSEAILAHRYLALVRDRPHHASPPIAGMMPNCAATTGLPRYNERAGYAPPATDGRLRRGHWNPRHASPDHLATAPAGNAEVPFLPAGRALLAAFLHRLSRQVLRSLRPLVTPVRLAMRPTRTRRSWLSGQLWARKSWPRISGFRC
jgi:hypothetical protein